MPQFCQPLVPLSRYHFLQESEKGSTVAADLYRVSRGHMDIKQLGPGRHYFSVDIGTAIWPYARVFVECPWRLGITSDAACNHRVKPSLIRINTFRGCRHMRDVYPALHFAFKTVPTRFLCRRPAQVISRPFSQYTCCHFFNFIYFSVFSRAILIKLLTILPREKSGATVYARWPTDIIAGSCECARNCLECGSA